MHVIELVWGRLTTTASPTCVTPHSGDATSTGAEKEAKWNNKFNHDKDAKPCSAYNNGVAHNATRTQS